MMRRVRSPLLQRLLGNTEGVAAVEFALLAPILLVILIGVFEGSRAIGLDRRFSLITSMTGDLVAREQDMGDDPVETIKSIMQAIDHVMGDGQGASLEVEIIPVMGFGSNGADTRTYAPAYRRTKDGSVSISKSRCSSYALPEGIVGAGDSVIVVEASYLYRPLVFSSSVFPPMSWSEKSTHSPRHACVDFEGNNCSVTCR